MQGLFLDSYQQCRDAFRAQSESLAGHGLRVSDGSIPVWGKPGSPESQSIDWAVFARDRTPRRMLLVCCGLHGAEGPAGSALQRDLLGSIRPFLEYGLGVLAVHAVNPYGFANFRRTTAGNVDLNRNCDATAGVYRTPNPGYDRAHSVLCPERSVTEADLDSAAFGRRLGEALTGYDGRARAEAVARGQYRHERGLYYGGGALESSVATLSVVVREQLAGAERVLAVDLHSGHGKHGQLHLFPDARLRPVQARIESLFAGHHVDWGDTDNFYSVTGEFVSYVGDLLSPECIFTPMVFELGTLDSHTAEGALSSVHALSLENQACFFGCASALAQEEVARRFRALFLPDSGEWRESVRHQAAELFAKVLPRFLSD